MGELFGFPEWLVLTLWLMAILIVVVLVGNWQWKRAQHRLALKRPNPSRDEFMAIMSTDVEEDVAAWMWDNLQAYYKPLTPHPDDHLIKDARIDDDDIGMDWLPDFAKSRGLRWQDWPEWPQDRELTVRNFALWLQIGMRDAAAQPAQRQGPAGT